jgi:hypothetical protein
MEAKELVQLVRRHVQNIAGRDFNLLAIAAHAAGLTKNHTY